MPGGFSSAKIDLLQAQHLEEVAELNHWFRNDEELRDVAIQILELTGLSSRVHKIRTSPVGVGGLFKRER